MSVTDKFLKGSWVLAARRSSFLTHGTEGGTGHLNPFRAWCELLPEHITDGRKSTPAHTGPGGSGPQEPGRGTPHARTRGPQGVCPSRTWLRM